MRPALVAAMLLTVAPKPAGAHRLDEYLQATILSIEKDRLQAEMTLTPGVAVAPFLLSIMDIDADGALSKAEQYAYAERVMHDLAIAVDGYPVTLKLISATFPNLPEMQDGRGEIKLVFDVNLPCGGRNRQLTFENHHQSRISAYQVNCLLPRGPALQIASQERNYVQSLYRLNYVRTDVRSNRSSVALWSGGIGWLSIGALLVCKRLRLALHVPQRNEVL